MTREEFEKLKPGDKVRIVSERVGGMNTSGKMDKWLGKVMTVRGRRNESSIQMKEDKNENGGGWFWGCNMIRRKVSLRNTLIDVIVRGNKTIAKRDIGKVGIAKCDPRDKFDESKGVIIAVARAYGWQHMDDNTGSLTLINPQKCVKPLKKTSKDRVQKELAELEERADKLYNAIVPIADKLGVASEAYSLLNMQLYVMRIYAQILRRRLAIWKD